MAVLLKGQNNIAYALGIDSDDPNSGYTVRQRLSFVGEMLEGKAATQATIKNVLIGVIIAGLVSVMVAGIWAFVDGRNKETAERAKANASKIERLESKAGE